MVALKFSVVIHDTTLAGTCQQWDVAADPLIVGRDEDADLVLADPSIARRHLEIRSNGEGWQVADLGGRSGSRLNEKTLDPGVEMPLNPGDKLRIGVFLVIFRGPADGCFACGAGNTTRASELAERLLRQDAGGEARLWLRIENGPDTGRSLTLARPGRYRLGRSHACDLVLDDKRISREHAWLEWTAGQWWIRDAGSANGCLVDGRPLRGRVRLAPDSRLRMGRIWLSVIEEATEPGEPEFPWPPVAADPGWGLLSLVFLGLSLLLAGIAFCF